MDKNDDIAKSVMNLLFNAPNTLDDVDDELDFQKIRQSSWKKNSAQYTKLLTNYVYNSAKTLENKRFQKKVFFWVSIAILLIAVISSAIIVIIMLLNYNKNNYSFLDVIPPLATFLTPLLVIPNFIVKYLFSTSDDDNMIEIVKQIISHDKDSV